jgi:hypothetical protein
MAVMTTSGSVPGDVPEVPAPGADAVPPLDRDDSGSQGSDRERGAVPSDAERSGTADDEADAARRH